MTENLKTPNLKTEPNLKVAVIGSGQMGLGIARQFAVYDCCVLLFDVEKTIAEKAIKKTIAKETQKQNQQQDQDKQAQQEADTNNIIKNLKAGDNFTQLEDRDLVIEAVPENFELKIDTLKKAIVHCGQHAIVATNTSSLSVSAIDQALRSEKPGLRFVGAHFFNPVQRMKLVELIAPANCKEETLATCQSWIEAIGKTVVKVADSPGFVVNRILIPMINEAVLALEQGVANASGIDDAMTLGAAHPIGPLALADLIGLDVCLAVMQTLHQDFADDKFRPAKLLVEKVNKGELGRKSGRGFFAYDPHSK